MAGADLSVGHCLELISGEFLATDAFLAHQKEGNGCGEEADIFSEGATESSFSEEEILAEERRICPENDELPWATTVAAHSKTWAEVLERDEYRCTQIVERAASCTPTTSSSGAAAGKRVGLGAIRKRIC
jgi:hypothetical protein